MYLRAITCARVYGIACSRILPRHLKNARPQCGPRLQQTLSRRIRHASMWDFRRHSHTAAAAAPEKDRNYQDTDSADSTRRGQSSIFHTTPSLRFTTFDRSQCQLGGQSRELWEMGRFSEQVARFLPMDSPSQSKNKRLQKYAHGKNKQDKLFVNKLLRDKALQSHNWRIALSELQKHYTPEETHKTKDIDTLVPAPGLLQIGDSYNQEADDGNEVQGPARKVASISRNYPSCQLARGISPPTEWSEASLAVYVEALAESQRTQAEVNWMEKPRLKGWTNIGDVVAAFDNIFYGSTSRKSLSVEACNTALRFFYDHGMMTKARALYIRMEDLKMQISTATFNILLRGSASQGDLHSFTFLLNNMTRRGFKPNQQTWTLFLKVIDSGAVRVIIVRKMTEMNMLDNIGTRRDVAAQMVDYEIAQHLGDGHDHQSFLGHMNSKYGVGWLSTSAGNKLLNELAKRKSVAESMSLLYEMKEAGFVPDEISLNTLLRHCLPLRQHELAIGILDIFKYHYGLRPGPTTYETLFLQAWRSRMLNFSTVIWRSACINGTATDKMQNLVFQSLLSYRSVLDKRIPSDDTAESSKISRTAKFQNFAGRFAIGVDGPRGAKLNQAMNTLELDPKKQALGLFESSLRVSRSYLLIADFRQLLRQALTMDKTWAAEGLYRKDDWQEMVPRAMVVDFIPKRWRKRIPPMRLRSSVVQGYVATRWRTRKRHLLLGQNRRKSPQSSISQPTAKIFWKIRSIIRRGAHSVKSRQSTRPMPTTDASPLSSIWRRPFIQQPPCFRSPPPSIPRSRRLKKKGPAIRSVRGVPSAIFRPLLLCRNRRGKRFNFLGPRRSRSRSRLLLPSIPPSRVRRRKSLII